MVRITGEYLGELHCLAVHAPSGRNLDTDAPKDNRGRGESFSPTDLTATSLVTCMATTMAIAAQRYGLELPRLRFEITKEMSSDSPRRIVRLATEIWLPFAQNGKAARILRKAAKNCPVCLSLNAAIDRPIVFHWTDAGNADSTNAASP